MKTTAAIDIGGTRTKLGLVSEDGRVLARAVVSTPPGGAPEPLLDAIARELPPLLQQAGSALHPTIGVSVAGFLDADHSRMQGNANLPVLCEFPLRDELSRRLGHECLLEVDSNAAVMAEYRHGAGRDARRLLGLTLGTGVGGGVILDGSLLRHTGQCAGDLGHVIVAPDGRPCTCGSRGCLEAMACSAALSERAGGRSVREIVKAARDGDRDATDALRETGHWLGVGLASVSALFAPDTIVVGGGIGAAGELLLAPARESFLTYAGDAFREHVRIAGSTFEGWCALIGAASLALEGRA